MLYKEFEIREKIAHIDNKIIELSSLPTRASVKGLSSSYEGRYEQLQRERQYWLNELDKLLRLQAGVQGMQGPDLKVY